MRKTLFTAALALSLLLFSCAVEAPGSTATEPTESSPAASRPQQDGTPEGYSRADKLFSLNYDPASPLNPYKTVNKYNDQLMGLIYEGLFALSPQLEATPVLCSECVTEDGKAYSLKLLPNIRFHDGSALTAEDVVYSLNTAKGSSRYASRLSDLSSVSAEGTDTVKISLKRANYQFLKLLDVPIVKNGTADEPVPPGTGPYTMGDGVLTAFASHRDYTQGSLRYIYLRQTAEEALAEDFSARNLDLLGYDPTGAAALNIHMVHESRYYDTSNLIYLGFNRKKSVTGDQLARRAILRLIDREGIVAEVFENAVVSSPFVLNPALGLYTEADAAGYGLSKTDFDRLAQVADLEDTDGDGFLDHIGTPFSLRFIVNSESPYKLAAAKRITTDLRNAGLNVTLDALTYSQYTSALSAGNFDIYLGEVRLRADLDLASLVAGGLNYGKIDDGEYTRLINEYLAAPEGEARVEAARALDIYAAEDVSIIPIAYKRYEVLTHAGVVSGAEPSQSGLFPGVLKWSINP